MGVDLEYTCQRFFERGFCGLGLGGGGMRGGGGVHE